MPGTEQAAEGGDDDGGDDEAGPPAELGWGSDRRAGVGRGAVGAGLPVLSGSRGHFVPPRAGARQFTSTCASPIRIWVERLRPSRRIVPVWPAPDQVMTQLEVAVTVYASSA